MKRMTLLTVLALVFSLFTVTAAIAGSGPGTGDGGQSGELDRLQAQTTTNTDAACQGDDCPAGDMVRTQEQAKDGADECQADDCQSGDAVKTQTKEMLKSGECEAGECEDGEGSMAQMWNRERLMTKLVAMLGAESPEVEAQYRLFLDNMLQKMLGLRVLFA
ncbi:MAG: hypothetical protein M3096_09305 [Actinomycetia bacterium]|nr:hypothetical protein [Actinomycetes bacterium]